MLATGMSPSFLRLSRTKAFQRSSMHVIRTADVIRPSSYQGKRPGRTNRRLLRWFAARIAAAGAIACRGGWRDDMTATVSATARSKILISANACLRSASSSTNDSIGHRCISSPARTGWTVSLSASICRADTDRMDSHRIQDSRHRCNLAVPAPSPPSCQSRWETGRLRAAA